jgi:hypothetical protein
MMQKIEDYNSEHPANDTWILLRGHRHVLESNPDSFDIKEIIDWHKSAYHIHGAPEEHLESLLAHYFIDRARTGVLGRYLGWTEALTSKWNKCLVYSLPKKRSVYSVVRFSNRSRSILSRWNSSMQKPAYCGLRNRI